jgi:long-chain acyl-CoA synthetase
VFRALQNFVGLRRARTCVTGAAPIPPKVFSFFRTIGVPLIEMYGQTETSGGILAHRLTDVRVGTVGEPLGAAELEVAPDGELLVRGPMVFEGYYKDQARTAETIVNGWLRTGDVVEVIAGHVRIVDRKKDVIITSGGKNLSPTEIESALKASPFIKEAIVIGDRRRYVAALIQIDFENVAKWAETRGLAFTTFKSLVEMPEVIALINGEVDAANAGLAPVEQVKRFHLLTKELDHDDDEVTATMKIRRANIESKFAAEIEALYSSRDLAA